MSEDACTCKEKLGLQLAIEILPADKETIVFRCIYVHPLPRADAGGQFLLILQELDRHYLRESANILSRRVRVVLISR
jgi:hypothetical protein